jgi:hypothetical protein
MSDFGLKIALLVIGALVGLLFEPLKRLIGKEKRHIDYSIDSEPLITSSASLPSAVASSLPNHQALNLRKYTLLATNVGNKSVSDSQLIVAAEGGEIMSPGVTTEPERGVKWEMGAKSTEELTLNKVELRPGQRLKVEFFVKSQKEAQAEAFWSGGPDDVRYQSVGAVYEPGMQHDVAAIVRYLVLAWVLSPLVTGLLLIVTYSLSDAMSYALYLNHNSVNLVGAAVASLAGGLVQLYFYLRIITPAKALTARLLAKKV